MRFGWGRAKSVRLGEVQTSSDSRSSMMLAATVAGFLALAACGRGDAPQGDLTAELAENAREAEAFLTKNASEEGVQTLPSGLQYKVLQSGPASGVQPDSNDLVKVDYEGALIDGTVFDSSFAKGRPFVTSPENVVPGWTEALQLMRPGDEWMVYVPPALGYGEMGGPPRIPGNAALVFRIQMLDVAPIQGGVRGVGQAAG